jgi:hypothetical protein
MYTSPSPGTNRSQVLRPPVNDLHLHVLVERPRVDIAVRSYVKVRLLNQQNVQRKRSHVQ